METTVKLQDLFSYSMLPIFISGGVILLLVIALIIIKLVKRPKKEKVVLEIFIPRNIENIKKKYLAKLEKIRVAVDTNTVTVRGAYQKMSKVIRSFAYEATGIKVQNYTLAEIRERNMPTLAQLVEEYYPPEFAKMSAGNVTDSLAKTKRVIEEWN